LLVNFQRASTVPAWVVAASAAQAPIELADSGERGSARLRLLTPLGDVSR
jgi:hypothetical protein